MPWQAERLFRAGEVGAVFLPSPESCFADVAGTVPADIGTAVARLRDDSGHGYHATQATVASRPLLARVPASGARNIHPFSQSDTGFAAAGTTPPVVTNQASHLGQSCVAIDFDQTMTPGVANSRAERANSVSLINGKTYAVSYYLSLSRALVAPESLLVSFTGSVNAGPITLNAANSPALVGEFVRMTGPGSAATSTGVINLRPSLGAAMASPVTLYINRVQVEEGPGATPYQRTQTLLDVTEDGVRNLYALAFDGVDDGLATGAIGLNGASAVSVFAGARKLGDVAIDVLIEHGPNNVSTNGTFVLQSTGVTPDKAVFASRGTARAAAVGTFGTAPRSAVLSGLGGIGTDQAVLRVNGVQSASSGVDQGTGSYVDWPIYIGRRGGTALPFEGLFFGAVVRFATSTPEEIARAETALATRAGVVL